MRENNVLHFNWNQVNICIPLTSINSMALCDEARVAAGYSPDLVEWRVDYLEQGDALATLVELRRALGDTPLLFTCRGVDEGGKGVLSDQEYALLNESALKSGLIDAVDIEWSRPAQEVRQLLACAKAHNVRSVLSEHHFSHTPPPAEIVHTLKEMHAAGADLPKMAAMPQSTQDVLALLQAAASLRGQFSFAAISMGPLGKISRILCEHLGSALTFATAQQHASAPGQLEIQTLRRAIKLLQAGFPDRIFLTGFMGCGKSTVGKLLSELLGYSFIDMDAVIEEQEGRTIAELFSRNGEEYFREEETRLLRKICSSKRAVISCGGGIVGRAENRALLQEQVTVFLNERAEVLFERVGSDASRPKAGALTADTNERRKNFEVLYTTRMPFYRECSLIEVCACNPPAQIAAEVMQLLRLIV